MIVKRSISKRSPVQQLYELNIGDFVEDELGRYGVIEKIEVIKFKKGIHFYLRLAKGKGTILILK